jgi:UDP-GlcNAc:undecaprenyl-phosphate GlcNAc-1-phosphate transferase
MRQDLVLVLCLSWLAALLLTPPVMRFARWRGLVDHPTGRKQHQRSIPLLGGVAVIGAMALGVGLTAVWSEAVRAGLWGWKSLGGFGLGMVAIVALGVYDDLRDISAPIKLSGQVLIAVGTWMLGFRAAAIELPLGWILIDTPLLSFLLTVAWIVIVTNAFNLIDGVDGLAAGTGIVAALTIFVLAADTAAAVPVVGSLALSGALAGFLRFNLPPAKVFLGDAGAMGIGYATAVLSVASFQKSPTAVVLIVPLLILGFPLLDTILAVSRRSIDHVREHGMRGLHPARITRAVMRADRGHIHHLLLRSGWSVRAVLFILYGISAGLGLVALWTRTASANVRWGLWFGLVVAGFAGLTWVRRRAELNEQREQAQRDSVRELPRSRRAAG